MAEETWFVAIDGRQLEGARSTDEVRGLVRTNSGKKIVVWNEKLTGWTDPETLPEFRPAAPAPPAPAPAPGPVAPRHPSPVAAAVAAHGPEAKAMIQNEAKFFRGLLDFRFTEFITPKIIRTLYIVAVGLAGLGLLAMIVTSIGLIITGMRFSGMTAVLGVVYLILSPLLAIIQITLARVFLELVLVQFKIKETLLKIEAKG